MVVSQPLFMENDTTDQVAVIARRLLKDLVSQQAGILTESSFEVHQRTVGADSSVDIRAGSIFIPHNEAGGAGFYHIVNDKEVNVIRPSPPDTMLSRIDTIIVEIRDSTLFSGGLFDPPEDRALISWISGTPSGSPVPPNVSSIPNHYKLANVIVPPGASNAVVTSAQITDLRTSISVTPSQGRASGVGGVLPCTSTTRPSSPRHGQMIWEEDTKQLVINEGTTTPSWVTYGTSGLVKWKNYSSSFPVSGSGVTTWGRYLKLGRVVFGTAGFRFSHTGTGNLTGRVQCRIPVRSANPTANGLVYIGGGRAFNSTGLLQGVHWSGTANVPRNDTFMRDFASGLGLPVWDATNPFDWGSGTSFQKSDSIEMFFCYEAES